MTNHIHATSSDHQHDRGLDHDPVEPGIDKAECPVMPGRFVVKAKAEAKGWVRHYAGRTYWLSAPLRTEIRRRPGQICCCIALRRDNGLTQLHTSFGATAHVAHVHCPVVQSPRATV